jgi:Ca2+-binding RTX toxin-like protein
MASVSISGAAADGDTLTANVGADPDGAANALTYQWFRDGIEIDGAIASTLLLTEADIDHAITVSIAYTDEQGFAGSVTSASTGIVQPPRGITLTGNSVANTLTGTRGADTLDGLGGNDTLIGLGGHDTLLGGSGNDLLNGGTGNDKMTGGTGNDTYVVDCFGDIVIELAGQGTDAIQTTLNVFSLAALGDVENLTFTGEGNFSGTGNGLANAIVGGTGDDSLFGDAGNDNLNGGAGNDVLDGGIGTDTMNGGAGDDTFYVSVSTDIVVEQANGGVDTVVATGASHTLSNNVENLTFGGSGNFSGTGNGLANVITGGTGNDTLNGGAGGDTMIGAAGNDVMNGGTGNDVFVFAPGFGADTINGFDANPGNGGQDMLDFQAFGITDFANEVVITDIGNDTTVTIGGNSILFVAVNGVGANIITQADFLI